MLIDTKYWAGYDARGTGTSTVCTRSPWSISCILEVLQQILACVSHQKRPLSCNTERGSVLMLETTLGDVSWPATPPAVTNARLGGFATHYSGALIWLVKRRGRGPEVGCPGTRNGAPEPFPLFGGYRRLRATVKLLSMVWSVIRAGFNLSPVRGWRSAVHLLYCERAKRKISGWERVWSDACINCLPLILDTWTCAHGGWRKADALGFPRGFEKLWIPTWETT